MVEPVCVASAMNPHLVETDEGVVLTPFSPEFDERAEAYSRAKKNVRNALHCLGK